MKESYSVPVVIQGETVRVHPVTAVLYADMAAAAGNPAETFAVSRRIVERCCHLADGSPVPFDDLTLASVGALIKAACGATAPDPTKPPAVATPSGTDSGG